MALARALVLNPDILLLDEPLSNLDAKIRVQVRAEIRRLQQELRHHDRLRHPRPGGGAVALRPRGGDARRAHPAGGHAQGAVRAAGEPLRRRLRRHQQPHPRRLPRAGARAASSWTRRSAWSGPGRRTAVGAGERCVLAVRPENVALGGGRRERRRADASRFASYLGNTLRYDVETAAGLVLKVDVRDAWHHELLPVGDAGAARLSGLGGPDAARRVTPATTAAALRGRALAGRPRPGLCGHLAVPDRLPRLPAAADLLRRVHRRGGPLHARQLRRVRAATRYYLRSLWNSMLLGLGTVACTTSVLGFAIAFLLVRFDFRGRDLFGYLTLIPIISPPLVGVLGFTFILGRAGTVNVLLHGLVRRGPADQLRLRPARRAAGGDAPPVPDDHAQRASTRWPRSTPRWRRRPRAWGPAAGASCARSRCR